MNTYKKWLSALLVTALLLGGCEKQENKIYFEGGTAPVLTASTNTVALNPPPADVTKEALRLDWTNPAYQFTTGVSSHDVSYVLEMDTLGGNFASGAKYTTSISRDLSKSFTVDELNAILGNSMLLKFGRKYTIEARVTSTLDAGSVPLISNKTSFTAIPFAPPPKVPLPVTGKLYVVGDATPGGWNNPVPIPSQEFTKKSDTEYEITVALGGGSTHYLFLPENGSWSSKFCLVDNTIPGVSSGGDFVYRLSGGQDIPSPAAPGNYRINVNFQSGKFTVVKL